MMAIQPLLFLLLISSPSFTLQFLVVPPPSSSSSPHTTTNNNDSPPDCSSAIVAFLSCLAFLQNNGTSPSTDCCNGILLLLHSPSLCLCALLSSATSTSQNDPTYLNVTRAMELPFLCGHAKTPSFHFCSASSPLASPSMSPSPTITITPVASPANTPSPTISMAPAYPSMDAPATISPPISMEPAPPTTVSISPSPQTTSVAAPLYPSTIPPASPLSSPPAAAHYPINPVSSSPVPTPAVLIGDAPSNLSFSGTVLAVSFIIVMVMQTMHL